LVVFIDPLARLFLNAPDNPTSPAGNGDASMQTTSKYCADHLRAFAGTQGVKLKATHARELVAAFFGYKSHASLLAETNYLLSKLAEAQVLVPDIPLMRERSRGLGLPAGLNQIKHLAAELVQCLKQGRLFASEVWLYDSMEGYATDILVHEHEASVLDMLSGVMAETNAYYNELYCYEAEVADNSDGVTITVTGQYNGSNDPDRAFCGDQIDLKIVIKMDRVAGRTAFGDYSISASGEVNDDWVDPDVKYGRMP
jgi:hypothetical protein